MGRGLALIGMVTTIAYPSLPASIIGFCLVGLGICTVIPLVAGAAARSSSMAPSSAIAAVLTIGFLGTLIGPPLIGFSLRSVRPALCLRRVRGPGHRDHPSGGKDTAASSVGRLTMRSTARGTCRMGGSPSAMPCWPAGCDSLWASIS